jgi:DNA-binding NtrC family response regulator
MRWDTAAVDSKRPLVLCVDADRAALDRFEEFVGGEFELVRAESAAAGLELAGTRSFDVICADGRFDGMHGLDLLKELSTRSPRSELVLFIAPTSITLDRAALESNICFVFKPVKQEAILATLRSLAAVAASRTPPA